MAVAETSNISNDGAISCCNCVFSVTHAPPALQPPVLTLGLEGVTLLLLRGCTNDMGSLALVWQHSVESAVNKTTRVLRREFTTTRTVIDHFLFGPRTPDS
ncbi:hypothetical protein EYF80_038456 [Liparis tanakae]|uniref:Uncharacterized protein n=1 Tax=Liparis tanakae TaxID=230148 RepID=A0A4Z2GCT5_9TELE|nr:hypothetical protein EYF80_038456 [Liparis tanakae]